MTSPTAALAVFDAPVLDTVLSGCRAAWSAGTAMLVRGAFTALECEAVVRAVYETRSRWLADFDAQQFSLGRAWYTHLEQGRSRAYFDGATQSDLEVEAVAPGLQQRLRVLAERLAGAPVRARPRWCGPGIQIFPVGRDVSRRGGCVHFDLEGLTPAMRVARVPARSLVLMLQAPARGGALRLWDERWRGAADDARQDALAGDDPEENVDFAVTRGPPALVVPYGVGDLVVFDSYQLHQIAPFEGERDRVTAAAHAALEPSGWILWF